MLCSTKLPQRPAFARSSSSKIVVSTYQLESSANCTGSVYILSQNLDIIQCIAAPAGVFRFNFYDENSIIAAITDGSLFITTLGDPPSSEVISVAEDILLDVSSNVRSNHVCCTDKTGNAYLVDSSAGIVISSWKAHQLPYADSGCEIWTCALNENMLCTGGEDATLAVWDIRDRSIVQRYSEFDAGVTFSGWQNQHLIITGSYDQSIRLFDLRNKNGPVKETKMPGGVWHIDNCKRSSEPYYLASCMYGGWTLLNKNLDLVKSDQAAGRYLLYGITSKENIVAYTTFNDYKVTTASI